MWRRVLAGTLPILVAALVVVGCVRERAMRVRVSATGETNAPCVAKVDGRAIMMPDFAGFARQWRGREAHMDADIGTPFRCIRDVIQELQRAGFRRIGFISEPAPTPGEQ